MEKNLHSRSGSASGTYSAVSSRSLCIAELKRTATSIADDLGGPGESLSVVAVALTAVVTH